MVKNPFIQCFNSVINMLGKFVLQLGILNASSTGGNQTLGNISILLPPSLFEKTFDQDTNSSVGLFFVLYETAKLLPLANGSRENYTVGSPVIGATVIGQSINNLTEPITIKLELHNDVRNFFVILAILTGI